MHLHRMEILCTCDVYVTFTYIYIYLQFCKCRIYTVFTPVCKHGICHKVNAGVNVIFAIGTVIPIANL